MAKKIRVFDIANEVLGVISLDKPSVLIPFKGHFPLLSIALSEEYYKYVSTSKTLDEVPVWVQDIINKGLKIKRMEDGFKEYLRFNGIFDEFQKMDNSKKATELVRFLNANCMSLEYLNID